MLEPISPGKVGNHYCRRSGHAQAFPAPLGSFKMHPLRHSRVAQVTEVQSAIYILPDAGKWAEGQEVIAGSNEEISAAEVASSSGLEATSITRFLADRVSSW
jgi:hypothetical protein